MTTGVTLLNTYKKKRETISKYKSYFPSTPMIMTEWGILGSPSFMTVLAVADGFMAIVEGSVNDNVVQQAGIHMFFHSNTNDPRTLIYIDNNEVVHTPVGVLYSKLLEVFIDSEIYEALSTSEEIDDNLPGTIAKAILKGDSIHVVAVNKLPEAAQLNIDVDGVVRNGDYVLSSYAMSPEQWPNAITNPSTAWATTTESGAISLPAYSINVISFQKDIVTATNEITTQSLSVFPNPSSDVFFVKGLAVSTSFILTNAQGKVVIAGKYNSNGVDVSSLSAGIYYFTALGVTQKIIVR